MRRPLALTLLAATFSLASAGLDLGFRGGNDNDLTSFVTRPEIRVPRFTVTKHRPDQLSPGYWFVAPYAKLKQDGFADNFYQPCQAGPAIYDQDGELIWSGACQFENHNAHDFRAFTANGSEYLSMVLWIWPHAHEPKGYGVVLDSAYNVVSKIPAAPTWPHFNMHELKIFDEGRRMLCILPRTRPVDLERLQIHFDVPVSHVIEMGFAEIDRVTGETRFEWWASDHISLHESTASAPTGSGSGPAKWSWLHMNSVDKNSDGDYMACARFTDAIYKVSGKDGSLLWTLGGKNSDFRLMDGLNFSRQHDARFVSQTEHTEVISFMDNGGDEHVKTADSASSLVVLLDKVSMEARVVRRWVRPEHKVSIARGNLQLLANGNAFTGWGDNGALSEHAWSGELLLEASFASHRFVNYRAYKANFTGTPDEKPELKVMAYGVSVESSTTALYVSWNGATEVAFWQFYRVDTEGNRLQLLGTRARTGFETLLQVSGYESHVIAVATAADGSTELGSSRPEMALMAANWRRSDLMSTSSGSLSESSHGKGIARDEL